ncbi:hypothetical protein [Candidatus Regiella insecticola]|uniref:hypothetical protein n=1 Tax=Candidatus Regiella insecticola TaxID=138073 RepID=UPI000309E770|nr:hypothetical protein [Candidatus Regiella insecticola]
MLAYLNGIKFSTISKVHRAENGSTRLKQSRNLNLVSAYALLPRRQGAIYPAIQLKDKEKYKTRDAIERFFGKIKEHKRLALHFDKLDITFFSFFSTACLKVFKLLC